MDAAVTISVYILIIEKYCAIHDVLSPLIWILVEKFPKRTNALQELPKEWQEEKCKSLHLFS